MSTGKIINQFLTETWANGETGPVHFKQELAGKPAAEQEKVLREAVQWIAGMEGVNLTKAELALHLKLKNTSMRKLAGFTTRLMVLLEDVEDEGEMQLF